MKQEWLLNRDIKKVPYIVNSLSGDEHRTIGIDMIYRCIYRSVHRTTALGLRYLKRRQEM